MKISKLILACVLSGMVGSVFAEPVRIMCKFDESSIEKKPEVEFDDSYPNQITVNGKTLPYTYTVRNRKGNAKLVEFNSSNIAWIVEEIDDTRFGKEETSWSYVINRKTGRITYVFETEDAYTGKQDKDTHRGTCTKMANNGF